MLVCTESYPYQPPANKTVPLIPRIVRMLGALGRPDLVAEYEAELASPKPDPELAAALELERRLTAGAHPET